MKCFCLLVTFLTLCSYSVPIEAAQIIVQLNLKGTGLNIDGDADSSANSETLFDSTYGSSVSLSGQVDSYGFSGRTALFHSEGFVGGKFSSLHTYVSGYGEGGWAYSPEAGGAAFVSVSDKVTLEWAGFGTPVSLPSNNLEFHFKLSGTLHTDFSGRSAYGGWEYGTSSTTVRFNSDTLIYSEFSSSTKNANGYDLALLGIPFTPSATINTDNTVSYLFSMDTRARTTYGRSYSQFFHSLTLDSITFADGTTPESRGYNLVFESGMTSPNLISAVPEPSSLAMLGVGSIAILCCGFRKSCKLIVC